MLNEPKLNNKRKNNIINPINLNIHSPTYKKNHLSKNKSSTKDKTNERNSLIKYSKKYLYKYSPEKSNMNYKELSLISSFSKNLSLSSIKKKEYKSRNTINKFSIYKRNKFNKTSVQRISSRLTNNSSHNSVSFLINQSFYNNKSIKFIFHKKTVSDKKNIINKKMNSIQKKAIFVNNEKPNKNKYINKNLLKLKDPKVNKLEYIPPN